MLSAVTLLKCFWVGEENLPTGEGNFPTLLPLTYCSPTSLHHSGIKSDKNLPKKKILSMLKVIIYKVEVDGDRIDMAR